MDDENKVSPDASVQDDSDSTNVDNSGTSQEDDSKYLNAKVRAEKAEQRAAAAEARVKEYEKSNSSPTPKPAEATPSPSVDVDERILRANGMPTELLSELKAIAAVRGVSLLDAQNDKLFVAVKGQYEKDEKHKQASVGASRGSGAIKVQKSLSTPGLTKEEHMKLVKGS